MVSIDDVIRQEINPFDLINIKPGNFWGEQQDQDQTIASIHQEAVTEIENMLNLVATDHRSRSILLGGDSGSGKSYLLGRLKRSFNSKAFFAYIGPWVDSEYIWRHTLRYTVDSLMHVPQGQQDSQLLLWLKSLSAFTKRNLKQRILDDNFWQVLQSDRQKFVKHLKSTYSKAGIYNADSFFGVLHDLTDPELYPLACEWLKGDDLSEESMQELKVKRCVDSEEAAKNILANFGKIANQTYPIVLCFDNLENIPKLIDGNQDFQTLFNLNTTIQNDTLKNFLVIISVVTNTWRRNADGIKQADKIRVDQVITLRRINLDQSEAMWRNFLASLHRKADLRPDSNIYPLNRQILEEAFPGGKTIPRSVVKLGRKQYQAYKNEIPPAPEETEIVSSESDALQEATIEPKTNATSETSFLNELLESSQTEDTEAALLESEVSEEAVAESEVNLAEPETVSNTDIVVSPEVQGSSENQDSPEAQVRAEFKLIWQKEHQKTQKKFTKLSLIPGIELARMVQDALEALEVPEVKPKLITGKYASYSLKYQHPESKQTIGLVWLEDASMNTFYTVMKACRGVVDQDSCDQLYLIRSNSVGKPNLAGNQLFRQIFTGNPHRHIKPVLGSAQLLATYRSLVNAAVAKDLVIVGKAIDLKELQSLTRLSGVFSQCRLLEALELIKPGPQTPSIDPNWQPVKDYLMNVVTTQQFLGRKVLVQNTSEQFSDVESSQIDKLVDQLQQENKIRIANPNAKPDSQTVCLVV